MGNNNNKKEIVQQNLFLWNTKLYHEDGWKESEKHPVHYTKQC